jgi:aminopeptidase-like protein
MLGTPQAGLMLEGRHPLFGYKCERTMAEKNGFKNLLKNWDEEREGETLIGDMTELYPICRSITGDGLRQSLSFFKKRIPVRLCEIPSGTKVFDWTVPNEWNIRDAYIKNSKGEKVVDFRKCNLHVLNYSAPIARKASRTELLDHIFTLPEYPDWIPYRTSYYLENWGFCISRRQLESLTDAEYDVCIDSTLEQGSMTYGEFRIPGSSDLEILISAHSCHPSLCNDNLSGMIVAAKLAESLAALPLHYSYRFLWIPGSIGAIAWLALNESVLPKIRHGLVLTCIGDPGRFHYKRSRRGNAEIDRAMKSALESSGLDFQLMDYSPIGYDERQYCSPGINLPVGCFMRTPNGKFVQYHTSADDLSFVTGKALAGSLKMLLRCMYILERNFRYENQNPKCEPQLGKRGLYRLTGGTDNSAFEEAILWTLNYSDGEHSLLDIAERSNLPFEKLDEAAIALENAGLLKLTNDE